MAKAKVSSKPGKFITLEGVDGAGKSTHLDFLAGKIRARGVELVVTREPGGTVLGEKLRHLLLNEAMQPDTELLLMYAARAEHVATVIKPALAKGAWVLSDRFHDASFAYQCGGRGIEVKRLLELEHWTLGDFKPDLTLLFDVAPKIAAKRRAQARAADRFEQEQADFFNRVREAYLIRARAEPDRIRVVDSALDIELIRADLDWILQTI
ncbi:MAG: dTMP kinase [Hydrogenophilaceae bacterium]|nr:dTMP kinase [Hydrogenophilaceae bacterium]